MVQDMDKTRVGWGTTREHAFVVSTYIAWFRQTENETYRQCALDMLQQSAAVEDMCSAWATYLFFAYEQTGEDRWRDMIEQLASQNMSEPVKLADAYDGLPFRMAYEMKLNRMAWVSKVVSAFKELHERLFDKEAGVHCAGEGMDYSAEDTAWFMLALVDAIELCDQQLYEHWRALVDIYRVTLRGVLKHGVADEAKLKIATSIYKAVDLGIIDPERYLPAALEMDAQQMYVAPTLKGDETDED